ncbi:MAG TPA: hypothetical protein VN632_02700 [Stellaceae bacterium]|nr:hypothetical protein [Stellaceae bacterium]
MRFTLFALLAVTLAGCQSLNEARPDMVRNTGLGDRCADYLRFSFPGATIQVTAKHVDVANTQHGGLGLMIVDVEGMRPDIPATGGFLARDIAARCRFQNGVLTEFRWTKGPNR